MKQIFGMLARVPLFQGFAPEDIERLAGTTSERSMRTGETLFQRGDPGSSMMVVLDGEVRVELADFSGANLMLQTLRVGNAFGELALFDGKPRSADVVATTNGRLLVLERRAVLDLMQGDTDFAIRVAEVLCERLRRTNAKLEALRFRDAGQRICLFLLQQEQESGKKDLNITQVALAEIVGATRETVNRRLAKMEAAGAIKRQPGRINILDRLMLQAQLSKG